ncbi:hypothetical protein GW17_00037458 [Ensete ventricosum]|nr:hypothetical protein GW17_00037458 [Ensete ventricosum]RZR79150.1 hypothetical protein BHM03_00004782 [Ensete ventricosum]
MPRSSRHRSHGSGEPSRERSDSEEDGTSRRAGCQPGKLVSPETWSRRRGVRCVFVMGKRCGDQQRRPLWGVWEEAERVGK